MPAVLTVAAVTLAGAFGYWMWARRQHPLPPLGYVTSQAAKKLWNWYKPISWIALGLAFLSAGYAAVTEGERGARQAFAGAATLFLTFLILVVVLGTIFVPAAFMIGHFTAAAEKKIRSGTGTSNRLTGTSGRRPGPGRSPA